MSTTLCNRKTKQALNIDGETPLFDDYSITVLDSIEDYTEFVDALAQGDLLMGSDYLLTLERYPLEDITYRYGIVSQQSRPVGFLYWQVKKYNLAKSLSIHTHSDKWTDRVFTKAKQLGAQLIRGNLLILGNSSLTGDYGFRFDQSIESSVSQAIVDAANDVVIRQLKQSGIRIHYTMVKDYEQKHNWFDTTFANDNYLSYSVDPMMVLMIRDHWKTFDDYLADMKSKARTRVKRAKKKGSDFKIVELDVPKLEALNDDVYAYYKNISSFSTFNLFRLHPRYFLELKRALGDKYTIHAIYLKDQLAGFYSTLMSRGVMHGHFLGYCQNINADTQLYLNQLYYMVNDAIEAGATSLELSRTALEIKSSIGAKPHDLNIYVKAANPLLQMAMKRLAPLFIPDSTFKERSPFKDL